MNYLQVSIKLDSVNEESKEIITAELAELGFESFVETETGIMAYIPENDFELSNIESLVITYKKEIPFTFEIERIEQKNWNAEWESNYQPIEVDEICLVRAPFHTIKGDFTYEIIVEPKMSFGTGHHETTYLMIKKILQMDITNKQVLDMGCGTGILAILASMKGASNVTAIDIDSWAYENAIENCAKNNVDNITVIEGDVQNIPETQYDIILANINRNILLEDIPHYTTHLRQNGLLLLSGIYLSDLPVIKEKAESMGLQYRNHIEKNNWISVEFIFP